MGATFDTPSLEIDLGAPFGTPDALSPTEGGGIAIAVFRTIVKGFDFAASELAAAVMLDTSGLFATAVDFMTPSSPIKPRRAKCLATDMGSDMAVATGAAFATATGAAFATAIFGFHASRGGHA